MVFALNKKRRHHYVWQFYLKQWAEGSSIWCFTNGRIFQTGTSSIGVEKDFYKLRELTEKDISLVTAMIERSTPELRDMQLQIVDHMSRPFQVVSQLKSQGICDSEIEEKMEELISNAYEDLHTLIEHDAAKMLSSIYQRDLSFLSDKENRMSFCLYLMTQYLRTRRMKVKVLGQMNEMAKAM